MSKKSLAIVGAGLMGRMLAWRRARHGDLVTLIDCRDRHSRESAALTAAAMIAPYTEAVLKDKFICELGVKSLELWPAIIEQLEHEASQEIFYEDKGTLVVAHAADRPDWIGFSEMAIKRLGDACFRNFGKAEIQELEPELAEQFDCASYFPCEAVLSNESLFKAFNVSLDNQNVIWIENTNIDDLTEVEQFGEFDWVIDCRGMGSRNSQLDLRGVRGEVIRVYAPEVNINRPIRLMHPRYPLYIAPHGNHQYVIGATEIESDAMHNVTVRSGLELLSALFSVHPGFAEAEIISMDANCRPAYPDNLPKIRVANPNMSINGLYRHGYLFAPVIMEEAASYIDGELEQLEFEQLFEISILDEKNEIFG